MTDASLTSEPEKLLPVTQDDIDAALELVSPHEARRIAARTCDDHMLVQAFARRAHKVRLSSPVSGTDGYVMVPRTLAEKLAKFATEWDRWQAKGSTSTERMVTFSYGQARIGLDDFHAVHALLSASPTSPVPMIAEAGERGARRDWLIERLLYGVQFYVDAEAKREDVALLVDSLDESDEYDPFVAALVQMPKWVSADYAQDAVDAALSTPATLDNTAVEGLRASVRGIRSNFERIAAHHPNDQPHYRDGVRPWGTGDLQHCIDTLLAVEATLTAKTEKAE